MTIFGLSSRAVQSILNKKDWVRLYSQELDERLSNIAGNKEDFPEKRFLELIKPRLESIFDDDTMQHQVRESIIRWTLIANMKAFFLIKLLEEIPRKLSEASKIYREYSDIPMGPQDEDTVRRMTEEERKRWSSGNVTLLYTKASVQNLLGIFVSELFFTLEATCRAICSGSCFKYAIKAACSNIAIQHNEIYKTLRVLAGEGGDNVTCKMCPISEECMIGSYLSIAQIYELFYHIRAIKDYRIEFYLNADFESFLLKEYMHKGFQALCVIDEVSDRLLKGYLVNPLPLSVLKKIVFANGVLNNHKE